MREAIARIEGFIMGINQIEGMYIDDSEVDKLLMPLWNLADDEEELVE